MGLAKRLLVGLLFCALLPVLLLLIIILVPWVAWKA